MARPAKLQIKDIELNTNRILQNGVVIVDSDGNIDAPITTTNLTTSGNTTLGDTSADTLTVPSTSVFEAPITSEGVATFEVAPVLEAGAQIDGPIYTTGGVVPFMGNTVQEVLTSSGAVSLTAYNYLVDTDSGALALTIGSPAVPYQRIRVQMTVDGGGGTNDATFTFNSTATIVLDGVGDYFELQHNGAEWIPIALVNLVDGSIPTYTPAA
jgi:hypothetical protein